jgi:hypothetical protein
VVFRDTEKTKGDMKIQVLFKSKMIFVHLCGTLKQSLEYKRIEARVVRIFVGITGKVLC